LAFYGPLLGIGLSLTPKYWPTCKLSRPNFNTGTIWSWVFDLRQNIHVAIFWARHFIPTVHTVFVCRNSRVGYTQAFDTGNGSFRPLLGYVSIVTDILEAQKQRARFGFRFMYAELITEILKTRRTLRCSPNSNH